MGFKKIRAVLAITLTVAGPAEAADTPVLAQSTYEELGRVLDELAGQMRSLGQRIEGQIFGTESPAERPLISFMLAQRHELGLTPVQVQELERLRANFQREAIRRDADRRVAEMELTALLQAEPVDLGRVEAKIQEIERLGATFRLSRIRTIEQGKAQLTQEQRTKLAALLSQAWPLLPGAGSGATPPRPAPQKL